MHGELAVLISSTVSQVKVEEVGRGVGGDLAQSNSWAFVCLADLNEHVLCRLIP